MRIGDNLMIQAKKIQFFVPQVSKSMLNIAIILQFSSCLSQILEEPFIQKTPLIQLAELLEHRPGYGEGQDVGRDMLSHGDIGRSYGGLGNMRILERIKLHASRPKRRDHSQRIAWGRIVLGSDRQSTQLVGIDKESHALEVFPLMVLQRADEQMGMVGLISLG